MSDIKRLVRFTTAFITHTGIIFFRLFGVVAVVVAFQVAVVVAEVVAFMVA